MSNFPQFFRFEVPGFFIPSPESKFFHSIFQSIDFPDYSCRMPASGMVAYRIGIGSILMK